MLNQKKQMKEQSILIIIYLSLLLLSVVSGFFAFIAICAFPILFTLLLARHDVRLAILFMLIGVSTSFVFETAISLPVLLLTVIAGAYIGHAIRTKHTAYETWAKGTIGFVIGFVVLIGYHYVFLSANVFDGIDGFFTWWLGEFEIAYTQLGFDAIWEKQGLDYDQFIIQAGEMQVLLKTLLPTIIIVSSLVLGFVTQWLSYKIINQLQAGKLLFPTFRSLSFPKYMLWFYLFVLLAQIMGVSEDSTLYLAVVNAYMVIVALLIIQGFSFIVFFTRHKRFHPALQVLIVIFFIISLPLTGIFALLLGIIDIGFSLKKRLVMNKYNKEKKK